MRSVAGVVLLALGVIALLGFGGWAVVLDARLAGEIGGGWGIVTATLLLPLTVLVLPWVALAMHGQWTVVLLTYGGGTLALLLLLAGAAVMVSHLGTSSGYGKPRRKIPFFG